MKQETKPMKADNKERIARVKRRRTLGEINRADMDRDERLAVWAGQGEQEGHTCNQGLHLCMQEIVE